ncbi:hypothetical protein PIB30_020384 [Stylosanthes scabra]|uniref:Uncharacterized protein n=1 Tax=Stylosanthes scabra TaxID=79078 RepID=A0ABU6Q8G2_9FABA|nr:hypothetical protein [Stylosanthes scabra]
MRFSCFIELAGDGIVTMIFESTKGTFMAPVLAEGTWLKPMTFDSGEPYLGLTLSNCRMGSGVIYYEYEKSKKFEDHDMKADAELGTFKIRRYHFDDESFVVVGGALGRRRKSGGG